MAQTASISTSDSAATEADAAVPQRPVILSERWQENWSVLADPALQTDPLDALKYIPLSSDEQFYLSLGANLRERVQAFDAALFGTSSQKSNTYLLDRVQVHADLRLDG